MTYLPTTLDDEIESWETHMPSQHLKHFFMFLKPCTTPQLKHEAHSAPWPAPLLVEEAQGAVTQLSSHNNSVVVKVIQILTLLILLSH